MITARPLTTSDLDAVVALLHAYDRRWFGEPVLSAEDVAAGWRSPAFDLDADSEGWEDEGALVAFGALDPSGGIELAVHEDWSGSGLEAALLDRWEGEARQRGFATVHRHLPAADRGGQELLLKRGWLVARSGWMLQLAAETPVSPGALPDGYAIRPMSEADVLPVFEVMRDAFAPYSTAQRSFADWHAEALARPDVTLEHCRVVTWQGTVVAACLVMDPPAAGERAEAWVPQLGVHPQHRRRGLARELLARTALAARGRGTPLLGLYTHSGTGARGLYERFGMVVRQTLLECTLEL